MLRREALKTGFAICVLSGLGAQFFLLMPVVVGALADGRAYGAKDLGTIAAACGAGSLVMGVTSPLWLRAVKLRNSMGLLAIALAAVLAGLPLLTSVVGMIIAMIVVGGLLGAIYTVMFGSVSLFQNPARILGWKLGTESLPGLLLLYIASSFVVARYGFNGVVYLAALASVLLGLSAILLPNVSIHTAHETKVQGARPGVAFWLAVLASTIQWTGVSAVWVFMERIGAGHGLPPSASGSVFALGWVGASAGGLFAATFGEQFGMLRPFLLAIVISGLALLAFQAGPGSFMVSAPIFLTASVFANVYAMSLITLTNTHSAYAALGAAAAQAATMLGPEAGGFAVQADATSGVLLFCGGSLLVSAVFYVGAQLLRRTDTAPVADLA
jgi:hypothetical protein